MKANVLMILLLSATAAVPSLADDALSSMFVGSTLQVAQMSPEQRRAMRERWEQASPEERMNIRRQFEERMPRRLPNPGDFVNPGNGFGGGYGTGFEQRRPDLETGAPYFDPRNRFNPPASRRRQ